MNIIYAGDSWALKGFTDENFDKGNQEPLPGDIRMADHWPVEYDICCTPGKGNLSCLSHFKQKNFDAKAPVVWVFTEPGRDYNIITGKSEFHWIESEEIFQIRQELEIEILKRMREHIPNPVALIGGLSDINVSLAESLDFFVLHDSWQRWIAEKLNSQWFKFGWGACDIGWRANYNNVKPSRATTFAWDEQIKEWCWWEEQGYFCHEHPTPLANKEFAYFLEPKLLKWVSNYE
jgi:hypothetical protein